MSDYILIFCILIPGITMFIFGISRYKKFMRVNEIAAFTCLQNEKTFLSPKSGWYSITTTGGKSEQNITIKIVDSHKKIVYIQKALPYKSIKNRKMAVTSYKFYAKYPGNYSLITNQDNATPVNQRLLSLPRKLSNNINSNDVSFTIKEFASPITYITALIGIIIGLQAIIFAICFLLYNHGFIIPSNSRKVMVHQRIIILKIRNLVH